MLNGIQFIPIKKEFLIAVKKSQIFFNKLIRDKHRVGRILFRRSL